MSKEPVSRAVEAFLAQHSAKFERYVLALSGGMDSVVLLHVLQQNLNSSSKQLLAVYIDHQLQKDSALWGNMNAELCKNLAVDYQTIKVHVDTEKSSLENQARKARYQALAQWVLDQRTCLLTAQHLDDQAETFLLQLFRGAGSKGLSAMPELSKFAQGFHARPLLKVSKRAVENYSNWHKLDFIDDPSNQNQNIRRNFLRHKVFPIIEEVWPKAKQKLSDAAELQAENQTLLNELAESDLQNYLLSKKVLDLKKFETLSLARQKNTLRYWLSTLDLLMPSHKVLNETLQQFLMAREDSKPEVVLQEYSLRRYQNKLYLLHQNDFKSISENKTWEWDGVSDLFIDNEIVLSATWLKSHYPELFGKSLSVTGRRNEQKIYFKDRTHSVSVKNYLQQHQVPPWLRQQILLIHFEGKVRGIYIPDFLK